MTCLDCKRPLVSGSAWDQGRRPEGFAPHRGRGYCRRDHERRSRAGELAPLNRRPGHTSEWVLERWAELQDEDRFVTVTYGAEKLGMSRSALDMALTRARRKGDPRARVLRRDMLAEADDLILEEWAAIRSAHSSIEDVAARLGISLSRLEAVLTRARARGDDRGNIPIDLRRKA